MDDTTCAYLINTTPKYFYLLPLHISLLHRYAPSCAWPIYIATEAPELLPLLLAKALNIIHLPTHKEAFFDSRAEAVRRLPPSIKYVFPIQEDFLLEGRPMKEPIQEAIDLLNTHPDLSSVRLMPCPGPRGNKKYKGTRSFHILEKETDTIIFTYQATIWRRADYLTFMDALIAYATERTAPTEDHQKKQNNIAIKVNLAEIHLGQSLLHSVLQHKEHIAWLREGDHPNAVYLCPWPYRPTAVVRGQLEPWAADLAKREGFSFP
jgi:hypothetical protein